MRSGLGGHEIVNLGAEAIVAENEAEQALVVTNCELITRFETKIQATFACVWGE